MGDGLRTRLTLGFFSLQVGLISLIGLQITGIASLVGAINLIVTVLNMRAPGMTLMKMPILTWMLL